MTEDRAAATTKETAWRQIRADWAAEQDEVERLVADLDEESWQLPTRCPGWSVVDQIGHLAYFDASAALAITDPTGFSRQVEELFAAAQSEQDDAVDVLTLAEFRQNTTEYLLQQWRSNRKRLEEAATQLSPDAKVDWFGPGMGALTFLTARLMETWTHAQDIAAALQQPYPATDRLQHICHLGFRTRDWSYINRGLTPPNSEVFLELTSPDGQTWRFGNPEAEERVRGSSLDFCRVVTRRVAVADTELEMTSGAAEWMEIAQAFAGPPAP